MILEHYKCFVVGRKSAFAAAIMSPQEPYLPTKVFKH
jgi:hypothetical protein